MLDFLFVLIRFFLATYSSAAPTWVSLPVVAKVGAIAPVVAGPRWLPFAPASGDGRGCRGDRDRSLRGSNGAGATAGRRMGPATGP